MELNILERILATGAVESTKPLQSNMITLKTLKSLLNKLLINEEEVKKYHLELITNEDRTQSYKWDDSGTIEFVKIELTPFERELLANSIRILDERNQLTSNHETLYDKLIGFATPSSTSNTINKN